MLALLANRGGPQHALHATSCCKQHSAGLPDGSLVQWAADSVAQKMGHSMRCMHKPVARFTVQGPLATAYFGMAQKEQRACRALMQLRPAAM